MQNLVLKPLGRSCSTSAQMHHLQLPHQHLGRVSHCRPRAQPAPQHCCSHQVSIRRPQTALQAQPSNSSCDGDSKELEGGKGPRPKRKYTRRKDPAEVSLVEYENEMVTPIEKARRMRATKLVEFEGQTMTVMEMLRIKSARQLQKQGRLNALPPGAVFSDNQPKLRIPPGPWGPGFVVKAPRSSQEGGTESPYHHWKDALQLAAHEGGARAVLDKPEDGVQVVTSAGKEYFKTVLPPFQQNQQLEGLDQATAKRAIVAAIKARMHEIHEQLTRYPQDPLASAKSCQ